MICYHLNTILVLTSFEGEVYQCYDCGSIINKESNEIKILYRQAKLNKLLIKK